MKDWECGDEGRTLLRTEVFFVEQGKRASSLIRYCTSALYISWRRIGAFSCSACRHSDVAAESNAGIVSFIAFRQWDTTGRNLLHTKLLLSTPRMGYFKLSLHLL